MPHQVERVTTYTGREVAPDPGLGPDQMHAEGVTSFTSYRPATPLVTFAMTTGKQVVDKLIDPGGQHPRDVAGAGHRRTPKGVAR